MDTINFSGLIIGLSTFLLIGLFHPIVIKAEYYFGTKCWWAFLLAGLVGLVFSAIASDVTISAICGVFAFSSFWSILELRKQKERVEKGWFPKNPRKK